MLTAIRELAEEAEAGGDLAAIVARGDDCVARTQEMLPVLTEAGVVDAGAAGLVEIVRGHRGGARRASRCRERAARGERRPPTIDRVHQELSRFRYCTVFVVEGDGLDADALEHELEPLGDSLLVVGDPSALKVHVHTDDPGPRALARRRPRHDRGRRDREHARPDAASAGAAAPRRAAVRPRAARSSPSRRGRATGACSRASARTSSTAAAR